MPFNEAPDWDSAREVFDANKKKGSASGISGDLVPPGNYLVLIANVELRKNPNSKEHFLAPSLEVLRRLGVAQEVSEKEVGKHFGGYVGLPSHVGNDEGWKWDIVRQLAAAVGYDDRAEGATLDGLVEACRDIQVVVTTSVRESEKYGASTSVRSFRKAPEDIQEDLSEGQKIDEDDIPF